MPDWDEDSEQLRQNLTAVLQEIHRAAREFEPPSLWAAKDWHSLLMAGLDTPDPKFIGAFRGEPGLENIQVRIGANYGVASQNVRNESRQFESTLMSLVAELDAMQPRDREPNVDELAAIIDLCAWAHAEWVRIHPFANGNGRTARLWANSLAMRYGLPPFIRLRPRPNAGYEAAGVKAMKGDWEPTAIAFRQLLDDFLNESGPE